MQQFTFHHKADRLRANVRVWQIAGSAEVVVMLVMAFLARPPVK